MEFYTLEPCASSKAYEIRFAKKINMKQAQQALGKDIISSTPVVILCKLEGKPVSIYASGRAMVKEVTEPEALNIARKLTKILENAFCGEEDEN